MVDNLILEIVALLWPWATSMLNIIINSFKEKYTIQYELLSLAFPLVGARITNILAIVFSVYFISRIGFNALSASGVIATSERLIMLCAWSILFGLAPLVSFEHAKKRNNTPAIYLLNGFAAAILISLIVGVILYFIPSILLAIGEPKEIVKYVRSYFHIYMFSVPFSLGFLCCRQYMSGIGKSSYMFYWSTLFLVILPCLCYIFVNGPFRFSEIIVGIAVANIIAYIIMFAVSFITTKRNIHKEKINILKVSDISVKGILKIIIVGVPIGLQTLVELSVLFLCAIFASWISLTSIAAYHIVMQYSLVLLMIPYGLSQAATILIAKSNSMKDLKSIHAIVNTCIFVSILFSILVFIFYSYFNHLLLSLYVRDALYVSKINVYTSKLFILAGIWLLLESIHNIMAGVLRGFFETKKSFLISFVSNCCIGLPLAYVFTFILRLGVVGIFYGLIIGYFFSITAFFKVYRSCLVVMCDGMRIDYSNIDYNLLPNIVSRKPE